MPEHIDFATVHHVLLNEDNGFRFEEFCNELISLDEGKTFLYTSRNYDNQIDGRAQDDSRHFICCGTTGDSESKARDDLTGMAEKTSEISRVIICCTEQLTVYSQTKITDRLKSEFQDIDTISMRSVTELAQLAVANAGPFTKHYAAEYQNAIAAIRAVSDPAIENQLNGLRLALTTQLHEDGQTLRSEIVTNLVLTSLKTLGRATVNQLALYVSTRLELPTTISSAWFQFEIDSLEEKCFVEKEEKFYRLSGEGARFLGDKTAQEDSCVEDFKNVLSSTLEALTGRPCQGTELASLWDLLESGLVSLFVAHGASIVRSLNRLLNDGLSEAETSDFRTLLSQLCDRIANIPGRGGRLKEVSDAFADMFLDATTPAFDYLSRIGEIFVYVCSLGLEPKAQDAIVEVVRATDILVDTDVILSTLSPGEQNHEAIVRLFRAWTDLGGTLEAPIPALEETSHHAFISEFDFNENEHLLLEASEVDIQIYVKNVFVRGFWKECAQTNQNKGRRNWGRYISMFRGDRDHDYSKIAALLGDAKISVSTEPADKKDEIDYLSNRLVQKKRAKFALANVGSRAIKQKCDRDARTAILLKQRQEANPDRNAVLLSTSGAVRAAFAYTESDAASSLSIWYLPSLAWVLAQCPGVTVNAYTLKKVLFNVDIHRNFSDFDRKVLRVARMSSEFDFHWGRRAALLKAVNEEVNKYAEQHAMTRSEVKARVARSGSDDEMPAHLLAQAVDKIAVSKSEKELAALREKAKQ